MHVDPPPIKLIKSKNDTILDKYGVKIKLRRDPMTEKLDLYELKMALFDNGNPEEFLLFIGNFQMNLEASRTLTSGAKIQYIYMLVHGEVLRQFDTLSIEVGSTTI